MTVIENDDTKSDTSDNNNSDTTIITWWPVSIREISDIMDYSLTQLFSITISSRYLSFTALRMLFTSQQTLLANYIDSAAQLFVKNYRKTQEIKRRKTQKLRIFCQIKRHFDSKTVRITDCLQSNFSWWRNVYQFMFTPQGWARVWKYVLPLYVG